jgi:RIP metalloprotease RseP
LSPTPPPAALRMPLSTGRHDGIPLHPSHGWNHIMTITHEPGSGLPAGPDHPPAEAGLSGGAGTGEPKAVWLRAAVLVVALVLLYRALGIGGLIVVAALVVSIVLHEFGHFWTARRSGMLVTEFFVGFGPRIWSFRRGETEYGLKVIPAGAYVRIIGMSNLEQIEPEFEDRTYRSKGYWKRLAVVLGGPFMNLLIGLTLFTVVFAVNGTRSDENWKIDSLTPGAAAEGAGLEVGDQIVALDGQAVGSFDGFVSDIIDRPGGPVTITAERDGQRFDTSFDLTWKLSADGAQAIASNPPLVANDRVLEVDGVPVASYTDLQRRLADAPAGTATLEVDHLGNNYTLVVDTPLTLPDEGAKGFLGIRSTNETRSQSVPAAMVTSVKQAGELSWLTLGSLGKIFNPANLFSLMTQAVTGDAPGPPAEARPLVPVDGSPEAVSVPGPAEEARPVSIVGMVQLGSYAADQGWVTFVLVIASINVLLALFNLLPMPPLDGGHAVVATYEAIRGRIAHRAYRVDMAKLLPVTYAVVGLLLVIGVTTITLDIRNPIDFGP